MRLAARARSLAVSGFPEPAGLSFPRRRMADCARRHRRERSANGRVMSDLNAFFGPNAGYVLELYDRYLEDPNSVDSKTRSYFEHFPPPAPGAATAVAAPFSVDAVVGAASLAQAIREFGHLAVQLDPLGSP